MSTYVCRSPVLVCGFNRPDLLANCLEHVRRVNPPKLYISIDGPREKRGGETQVVEGCRSIATSIDWCDEVHLKIEPVNLGCRRAIEGALDWFFEAEPEGIILEDDIEASSQFFQFCDLMLDRYRNDDKVGSINGWTPIPTALAPPEGSYLTKYSHIWGWASWRRTWWEAEKNARQIQRRSLTRGTLMSRSHGRGIDQYWWDRLQLISRHGYDTWDITFAIGNTLRETLSISPHVALTQNIGFGTNATHTAHQSRRMGRRPLSSSSDNEVVQIILSDTDLDWAHDKYQFGFGEGANYWPRLKSKAYYYLHVVPFGKRLITFINRFR